MPYIELHVRTAMIVHGFDDENKEIVEEVQETDYVRKIIALERIQSISQQYLLVTSSHGRVMYWEYEETLDDVKSKLNKHGFLLS